MQRPTGVTLAAAVLGCVAAFAALAPCMLLLTYGVRPTALSPGFFVSVLLLFALTGWGIATVVGILRLRAWARHSIRIIGALIVAINIFSAARTAIYFFAPPDHSPRSTDPRFLYVFIITECVSLAPVAIGAWWLFYFSRPATRAVFESRIADVQPDTLPHTS